MAVIRQQQQPFRFVGGSEQLPGVFHRHGNIGSAMDDQDREAGEATDVGRQVVAGEIGDEVRGQVNRRSLVQDSNGFTLLQPFVVVAEDAAERRG